MKARKLGALVLFILLATANSGGYRFGVGDQAFYQPATELRLHPEWFPRDRALIESQATLTVVDEALAGAARLTRLDLPQLFFLLYLVTLVATCAASAQLARVLGLSPAATALFLVFLTIRHRIAKTGANTLEGYMHPRQLAFALGIFAFTASIRRRWLGMALCWLAAAVVHPTTALWWAVAIAGAQVLVSTARQRALMAAALGLFLAGPLLANVSGLAVMDDQWLRVLDAKDYLFASGWPAYAWLFNLGYVPLILALSRFKADARLIAPTLALFAVFVASYPMTEAHVALSVQMQVSRVFWLLDFFTALLGAWLLADGWPARRFRALPAVALAVAMLFAAGRGLYTLYASGPGRSLVRLTLPADDWSEAMSWIRAQPADWLVLAHPDHAWLYGSSVRVAAGRDVVVESVKDSAISMYDRGVAMRTAERLSALAQFDTLGTAEARALGRAFQATVVITDATHPLDLPLLHRNATFAVYDLR